MSIRTRRLAYAIASATIAATVLVQPAQAAGGPSEGSGRPLHAVLTGAAEVPGPGDPDGSGTAHVRINPGQRSICYTLRVSRIAPASAAHIHEAPVGQAGPVLVTLSPPTSGTSSGCVQVTRDLARDILRSPADYYVNVHNAEYPAGAVRGQLSR